MPAVSGQGPGNRSLHLLAGGVGFDEDELADESASKTVVSIMDIVMHKGMSEAYVTIP